MGVGGERCQRKAPYARYHYDGCSAEAGGCILGPWGWKDLSPSEAAELECLSSEEVPSRSPFYEDIRQISLPCLPQQLVMREPAIYRVLGWVSVPLLILTVI